MEHCGTFFVLFFFIIGFENKKRERERRLVGGESASLACSSPPRSWSGAGLPGPGLLFQPEELLLLLEQGLLGSVLVGSCCEKKKNQKRQKF